MNINLFFVLILAGLTFVFVYFKPIKLKENKNVEIANVETYSFIIHQLDTKGLTRVIKGKKAFIYQDRYNILDVDYTDATKNKISNITAKKGVYKDKTITLHGDVKYIREDGLALESQSLNYNEKTSILKTNNNYVIYKNKDRISGTYLKFDNNLNKINSKNVQVIYKMESN